MVVTGEDLPNYLTDRRRRSFFHPELQAELEFGIDQSSKVSAQTILDNFKIFLEHDAEWEEANENILEARENATQDEFPAMDELAAVAPTRSPGRKRCGMRTTLRRMKPPARFWGD